MTALVLICAGLLSIGLSYAQTEQQIKTDLQKKLGASTKIRGISASPLPGIYEILVGNEVFYTDAKSQYLIQGEMIELATGKNLTEQRQNDLNRIKWSDLPQANAIKQVRGNGSRQFAIFSDPNCGFCKRLEKSMKSLDNVTIYTFLIPILGADSLQKSKQIWCSSDPAKTYNEWMLNANALPTKTDCPTPLDKNLALAKTYGITGTPTLFFTDGSRFPGAVQISDLEKKLDSLK